jgi:hypothetical protein
MQIQNHQIWRENHKIGCTDNVLELQAGFEQFLHIPRVMHSAFSVVSHLGHLTTVRRRSRLSKLRAVVSVMRVSLLSRRLSPVRWTLAVISFPGI